MDDKILRKLQLTELDILNEIVRICEKHNLKYFLAGGTLLGSVRHKGFIPWDDDIDIGMLRSDYDKFISICKYELNQKYFIHYSGNDKKYYLNFLKIRMKNTFFDEKMTKNIDTYKEIFVDIFPYDYIKNPESKLYKLRTTIYNVLTPIILYKRGIISKEKLPKPFLRFFFKFFTIKQILKFQKCVMIVDNNHVRDYVNSFSGSYYEKELFKTNDMLPPKKLKFENSYYNVPNNYDKYLTQIYGNYMKLPPKNKQVAHCPAKIIFDVRKGE